MAARSSSLTLAEGSDISLNEATSCWLGNVSVSTSSRVTTLWANAREFGYVQLFTGDGLPEPKNRRSGLAVEPMTCPPNALRSGESLLQLASASSMRFRFGISATSTPPHPKPTL